MSNNNLSKGFSGLVVTLLVAAVLVVVVLLFLSSGFGTGGLQVQRQGEQPTQASQFEAAAEPVSEGNDDVTLQQEFEATVVGELGDDFEEFDADLSEL